MTLLDRLSIYLIVAGVAVLIAGGLYGRYEYLVRQNVALKEQKQALADVAKANKEEFDRLDKRFDALDKTLAERAKREQSLQAAINGVRRDLNGLKKQDPVVQKWSDEPVPPALSERLRNDPAGGAPGDGQGQAASKPPKPLPGTAVVRAIERGLVRVRPDAPPAPARVQ